MLAVISNAKGSSSYSSVSQGEEANTGPQCACRRPTALSVGRASVPSMPSPALARVQRAAAGRER